MPPSPSTRRRFNFEKEGSKAQTEEALRGFVENLQVGGATAIYSTLDLAYDLAYQELSRYPGRMVTVVLLTDGKSNHGLPYAEFHRRWAGRPAGGADPIRTFPILFGEASSAELDDIARLSGGRSFDGRSRRSEQCLQGDPGLPVSIRTRLLLYLYSTRNIVACAAALVGPALLFLGLIQEGWLLITAALYGVGYFATPAPQVMDAGLAQSLTFDALLDQFDRVIKEARPQLQPVMLARLDSIRHSIGEVLPRLAAEARVR